MTLQDKVRENQFLNKYFEIVNNNILCRRIEPTRDINGTTGRYSSLYIQISNQKNLSIEEKITLQNAIMVEWKKIMSGDSKNTLVIDYGQGSILLDHRDFPDDYTDMCHPDDYIISSKWIQCNFIYNHGILKNERLIVRTYFSVLNKEYMPISFIIDTGCPHAIYLSSPAATILRSNDRLLEDEAGTRYILIDGKKIIFGINTTHGDANLIGLPFLSKFGASININQDKTYSINGLPNVF